MEIIHANRLVSISYSIWIWAIGKAQLHYWLQCPCRYFQNVTDHICCLRLKASALLAFVWVANEPSELNQQKMLHCFLKRISHPSATGREVDAWQSTASKLWRWLVNQGKDVAGNYFRTPSYLSQHPYFQSQKSKSEQFVRKSCVMITHAPVTSQGGRPTLFPLWWTPVTTSSSSASVPEPHPRHQAGGHAGASHVCATPCTVTGTSNRLPNPIPALVIAFLQTLLFQQLVEGMSFTASKQT